MWDWPISVTAYGVSSMKKHSKAIDAECSYTCFCAKYAAHFHFTEGQFLPLGIVVACVCVCVCLCVSLCLNHLFVSAITHAIYTLLNMWVCPCEKSPPIEVRNFISRPKMHLSPVKVRIDFEVDWPCMIFSLIFNFKPVFCLNKLCVSYSFASLSIYLVRPHGSAHILIFMHADWVLPWTVKQSRFINWWDHWSSASLNWILQASISFRHNTGTHAGIARLRIDQHYF